MISDNNELILEVWSRIKSYIPAKERMDAAEVFVAVFDDFGMADKLSDEQLDKELRAAVNNHFGEEDYDEDEDYDEL